MRTLRCLLILLTLASPPSLEGAAGTLGDAGVGFSAERILVIDGKSYAGRMWHMPGMQRHEQTLPAIKPIFILHAGSTIGDVVLPQLHTVVEFAIPDELSLLEHPAVGRKPLGQETVNGISTTKYELEEQSAAGRASGLLWLSADGIPMRCDTKFEARSGKITTIRWELRNVRIGTQDAALFEVPRGYAKLPPEAAAPLLGIRLARPPAKHGM